MHKSLSRLELGVRLVKKIVPDLYGANWPIHHLLAYSG
jgi:hypothetical protein